MHRDWDVRKPWVTWKAVQMRDVVGQKKAVAVVMLAAFVSMASTGGARAEEGESLPHSGADITNV